MNKQLLNISMIIMLFTLCGANTLQAKSTKDMNVLFIAIDDLNDWIGCFEGNPQIKTPNFDKFNANGGMVMFDAHCSSTVCGPSRSSLLTGKHCYKTGVYGNKTNLKDAPKTKDVLTIPEYFSKHGYHSLSMGKIFHKHGTAVAGKLDHGEWAFDEWHKASGYAAPINKQRPANGIKPLDHERGYHRTGFDWGATQGNDETKMKDYNTVKWASEQFNTRDFDGKPFFMALGISQPHLPWYVPQKYFDMYPLDEIDLPKTLANDRDDIISDKGKPLYALSTTWERFEKADKHKEVVQAYMANVSFVDDCLGVLLEGLNKSKYADNTIVILWGDHGWHLGEKQRYGKTLLWQESARVPMMIKVPGVTPKSKRCNGVVNLIDMYPTLADLCGLPPYSENDGRSFAELVHNPDMTWDKPTLTTYGMGNHRIYDGRYSYIIYKGGEELYDHKTDPMEWTNQARNPEFASIKKRLHAFVPKTNEPTSPINKFDGNKKPKKK
ncbi:iduronate-2-sulfatase [Lentisphaera araneosa HTCC2155]|uniref:Iduronate-2-sulfatase n=1 Tax=Lentisphaera araneosa HTCC2155 TaxID=313628 RepID=A6DJ75_9BACT|nr:sulfatase [Lentisphaera araneosa]EDM28511.1 iduronate-2-sulfatase [Lentisphaera araneosa HTCC2155]